MRVRVRDCLASMTTGIEHHSVSAAGNPVRQRYLVRLHRHFGKQAFVCCQGSQVPVVLFRNHQHVSRRLWIYVTECERPRTFQHNGGWYVTGRDSAE
jgi:hypothetical protein